MPDHLGPRSEALKARRAQARKRRFTGGGLATVLAALLAAGGIAYLATDREPAAPDPMPAPTGERSDPIAATLLFGTRETGGPAVWMTLLAYDTEAKSGSIVFIPAHSAVEVPGRGLQGVGDALATGGPPLLLVSTENLLGIEIDSYIELSDRDAFTLFEATGPVSVDVPEDVRVPAGQNRARLLFSEGLQRLGPEFLVDLLYIQGLDSDDIELGSRHVAFWDGLFDAFGSEPENLTAAIRSASGSLIESDSEPADHARLFGALARLDGPERTITTLPVQQVSVGGSELYEVDREVVAAFLSDLLSGVGRPSDDIRVQVLNGNGVPGIGQEVSEVLIDAGYRVVLTGNAPRLNYRKTLVITYDDSPEGLALAERTRKLVGVGEVQVSGQSQGIVDLTIVIGKDFLRTR